MLSQQIFEFIESVNAIGTEEELVDFFHQILSQHGITCFAVAQTAGLSEAEAINAGTFPAEWVTRYIHEDYCYYDPVVEKAKKSARPFDWHEVETEGFVHGRGKDIYLGGRDFGLKEGYTVPIFRAAGYLAVASFSGDRLDPDPNLGPAVELMSVYFHSRLLALKALDKRMGFQLSQRERECLHWAAAGKSDWEIGEILTISKETVHRHVENAKGKYGVTTRVQAVLEGLKRYELHI